MPATMPPPARPSRTWMGSPIGKKLLTGVTGLLLVLYLLQHLYANLQVLGADPQAVSKYALLLQGFGPVLQVIEAALALCFLAHIVAGVRVWLTNRRARAAGYAQYRRAGTPSRQTLASRTMAVTGLVLLAFLVLHVAYFRFGPGIAEGYVTYVGAEPVRHFERLVHERFRHGGYVLFYGVVMVLLGLHLSHGFWSAFQSLGWANDRGRRWLFRAGIGLSVLIAAGFLSIPLWIYFGGF